MKESNLMFLYIRFEVFMMEKNQGYTLEMEATCSSTVLVTNHQTTQCHNPQDYNLMLLSLILWQNMNPIY
jgi:hypothetical protein